MERTHLDALVVGAGPAGSVAALTLARAGAAVGLLDKAAFPRDKACGDLVGPRGVQLLDDLGVALPPHRRVGDMDVIGPAGRRVRLPSAPGLTYPGHAVAVTRRVFDDALRTAALDAGALAFTGRAGAPVTHADALAGFEVGGGRTLEADVIIGADGATSHVAACAGLVDPAHVLWGFAVRAYVEATVTLPIIVLWDEAPRRGLPGYGWAFPGPAGGANIGLGVGTLGDRQRGAAAVRALPAFCDHLARLGVLDGAVAAAAGAPGAPRLGGWLKMGMVGTRPAAGRTLLVGDAAGLVNPLQGEGIAQAMGSGRAAAVAVLADPGRAADRYTATLGAAHLPYHRVTAALQRAVLERPRVISALGRTLTAPVVGRALAGSWAILWNELLDGAPPGRRRAAAAAVTRLGDAACARGDVRRWFDDVYGPRVTDGPGRSAGGNGHPDAPAVERVRAGGERSPEVGDAPLETRQPVAAGGGAERMRTGKRNTVHHLDEHVAAVDTHDDGGAGRASRRW